MLWWQPLIINKKEKIKKNWWGEHNWYDLSDLFPLIADILLDDVTDGALHKEGHSVKILVTINKGYSRSKVSSLPNSHSITVNKLFSVFSARNWINAKKAAAFFPVVRVQFGTLHRLKSYVLLLPLLWLRHYQFSV